MPKVNKSQYAILGFLSGQDLSGYDIAKYFKSTSGLFWTETTSQIYPVLKKLTQDGMILVCNNPMNNVRGKKMFRITPKGQKLLEIWLNSQTQYSVYREELFLKLLFSSLIDEAKLIEILTDYKNYIYSQNVLLKNLEISQENFAKNLVNSPVAQEVMNDYFSTVLDAKSKWVCRAIKKIKRSKKYNT